MPLTKCQSSLIFAARHYVKSPSLRCPPRLALNKHPTRSILRFEQFRYASHRRSLFAPGQDTEKVLKAWQKAPRIRSRDRPPVEDRQNTLKISRIPTQTSSNRFWEASPVLDLKMVPCVLHANGKRKEGEECK